MLKGLGRTNTHLETVDGKLVAERQTWFHEKRALQEQLRRLNPKQNAVDAQRVEYKSSLQNEQIKMDHLDGKLRETEDERETLAYALQRALGQLRKPRANSDTAKPVKDEDQGTAFAMRLAGAFFRPRERNLDPEQKHARTIFRPGDLSHDDSRPLDGGIELHRLLEERRAENERRPIAERRPEVAYESLTAVPQWYLTTIDMSSMPIGELKRGNLTYRDLWESGASTGARPST